MLDKKIIKKVIKAVSSGKLNPEILGERNWYQFFIRTTELFWGRNCHDGYKIEVYTEKYGEHLATVFI